MAIRGRHRTVYAKFSFLVYVSGFKSAAFTTCSPVQMTTDKVQYREGGALLPLQVPGLTSVEDITLERGVTDDLDFYNWVLDVTNATAYIPGGKGKAYPNYWRDMRIEQLRRDRTVAIKWSLKGAFPIDYSGSEWDNDASEVAMESLTIGYQYFERSNV